MNKYETMKNRQQKEFDAFPIKFAFSNAQFKRAMEELGLTENDTDKIYSVPGNGFFLKEEAPKFNEMLERFDNELQAAINADPDGFDFVFDMFNYELANHEYCITYDAEDAIDALGLNMSEIESNPKLLNGFNMAINNQTNCFF